MSKKYFFNVSITLSVIGFIIWFVASMIEPVLSKERPVTIVTCKDIYYVYEDSIVTETGRKIVDFKKSIH